MIEIDTTAGAQGRTAAKSERRLEVAQALTSYIQENLDTFGLEGGLRAIHVISDAAHLTLSRREREELAQLLLTGG